MPTSSTSSMTSPRNVQIMPTDALPTVEKLNHSIRTVPSMPCRQLGRCITLVVRLGGARSHTCRLVPSSCKDTEPPFSKSKTLAHATGSS